MQGAVEGRAEHRGTGGNPLRPCLQALRSSPGPRWPEPRGRCGGIGGPRRHERSGQDHLHQGAARSLRARPRQHRDLRGPPYQAPGAVRARLPAGALPAPLVPPRPGLPAPHGAAARGPCSEDRVREICSDLELEPRQALEALVAVDLVLALQDAPRGRPAQPAEDAVGLRQQAHVRDRVAPLERSHRAAAAVLDPPRRQVLPDQARRLRRENPVALPRKRLGSPCPPCPAGRSRTAPASGGSGRRPRRGPPTGSRPACCRP